MRLIKGNTNRRQYLNVLVWLLKDALWHVKWKLIVAIVPGILGMSLQVSAIGLILYFANIMVKGESISRFGMAISPMESHAFIFLFAVLVGVILMLSSWMSYFSKVRIIRLGTKYETFCIRRAFSILNRRKEDIVQTDEVQLYKKALDRLIGSDARRLGRIFVSLSQGIVPAATCVTAVCALVYINIPLTGLVAILAGISILFYEKVSAEGEVFTRRMGTTRRVATKEKAKLIDQMAAASSGSDIQMAEIDHWLDTKTFQESLHSNEGRLLTASRASLIGEHLALISIFLLFMLVGVKIVLMKEGWSELVVYLVALRYFIRNFQQVTKRLTRINRFYANITRQYEFVVSDGSLSWIRGRFRIWRVAILMMMKMMICSSPTLMGRVYSHPLECPVR